jgi:phospholipid/cholesterol/gamma-HCH transport system ATP-binding protein
MTTTTPPAEAVIEVQELTTRFGPRLVHDRVSLTVYRGEVLAIVGGSGSGKTTLLREIIMLQRPNAGSIRVLGEDVLALGCAGGLEFCFSKAPFSAVLRYSKM